MASFLRSVGRVRAWPLAGCAVAVAMLSAWAVSSAAETEPSGILALATEEPVVKELGFTEQQLADLKKVVESRQSEAAELAEASADLPPAEQQAKLDEFHAETARLALAGLTPQQRLDLDHIRIRRLGLAALGEPSVAQDLLLSDQQKAEVARLLALRAERLARADKDSLQAVWQTMEEQLAGVLSQRQQAAWDLLTAKPGAATAPSTAELASTSGTATGGATEPAAASATESVPATPGAPTTGPAGTGLAKTTETSPAETAAPDEETSAAAAPGPAAPEPRTPGFGPTGPGAPSFGPGAPGMSRFGPGTSRFGPPTPGGPGASRFGPPSPGGLSAPGTGPSGETAPETAAATPPPVPVPEPPPIEPQPGEPAGTTASAGAPGGAASALPGNEVKLRFSFQYQPWQDVLKWFASQAGLSLSTEEVPPGTFNYIDDREYTPTEALDLLNSVLLTKGFVLVRRDRMLMLINREDGIPDYLVDTITPEELDQRGEYELVSVVFNLDTFTPEEAETEIKKFLGPNGTVKALPKSRQVLVTDTAGRLRAVRTMIERVEDPKGLSSGEITVIDLEHVLPDDVLAVVRPLLELPDDSNGAEDGSIRIAVDQVGQRLLVTGKPQKIERVQDICKMLEAGAAATQPAESGVAGSPQLEVYNITGADPQAVLAVLQTLLAGLPDVRLAIDQKTGNLIAQARPTEQATIRATIDQMQRKLEFEVFTLQTVDPTVAVLAINKMFGGGTTGSQDSKSAPPVNPNAPIVDADPTSGQLFVRGTAAQIADIKSLLEKMGETSPSETALVGRGKVRMFNMEGSAARTLIDQALEVWPSIRPNRIRVVTPSAVIPSYRPSSSTEPATGSSSSLPPASPQPLSLPTWTPSAPAPGGHAAPVAPAPPAVSRPDAGRTPSAASPAGDQTTAMPFGARVWLASEPVIVAPAPPVVPRTETAPPVVPGTEVSPPSVPATEAAPPAVPKTETPPAAAPQAEQPTPPATAGQEAAEKVPPVIIVSPGPGGIMIASEDEEALDEFENLLNTLSSGVESGAPEITIFYLKYAKADLVAETLDQIFGGGTLPAGSSGGGEGRGGGGPMGGGGMGGGGMGGMGGGILDALLGMGQSGQITPTGTIRITPEARLNALVVQANATDLGTIEQLLKILDQEKPPEEVMVIPKVKVIPLRNTQAQAVATIIQQVYQDRLVTGQRGAGGPQQQGPSPQELFQMLQQRMGGSSSRGGSRGGQRAAEEVQKLALSVDERTNSLVLAAPEPLFTEVQDLIANLDRAESDRAVRVIPLRNASPDAVQQALSGIDGIEFGGAARPSRSSSSSSSSSSPSPPSYQPPPSSSYGGSPYSRYGSSRSPYGSSRSSYSSRYRSYSPGGGR